LELIICLPVWLIILAAAVEFGLFVSRLQQVALATRVGAMQAAQTTSLDQLTSVPPDVLTVIDHQLEPSNIEYCRVILQHNVGVSGTTPVTRTANGTTPCTCDPPSSTEMPFPQCGDYVRVTVCIRMTDMTPNLLSMFGYDITNKIVQRSTTYRYESTATTGTTCSSCTH
jgi:hypothetical protein